MKRLQIMQPNEDQKKSKKDQEANHSPEISHTILKNSIVFRLEVQKFYCFPLRDTEILLFSEVSRTLFQKAFHPSKWTISLLLQF